MSENQHNELAQDSTVDAAADTGADVFADIAASLADNMPQVSDHAINEAAEQARKNNANADGDGLFYKDGTPYDPEIHEISPVTGKVVKKKRGGGKTKSKSQLPPPKNTAPAGPSQAEIQARAAGKMYANGLIALAVGIGGDEFNPRVDEATGLNERDYLEQAFGEYCVATGKNDLPPGLVLTIAIGSYIVPRFNQPKTRTRLQRLKDWAASKWLARRAKKAGQKIKEPEKSESKQEGQ